MIDWCQITVKDIDVFTIIEDILRIPLNLMELHYKGKGIAGHELIAGFDNIKILKPTGNAGIMRIFLQSIKKRGLIS